MKGKSKTILITFGHRHGPVPPHDMYVDVRDVENDYAVWEKEAKQLIKEIEPGTVVAIGCDDGDDRSVHIARLIQKYLGDDVGVIDRDLNIVGDE